MQINTALHWWFRNRRLRRNSLKSFNTMQPFPFATSHWQHWKSTWESRKNTTLASFIQSVKSPVWVHLSYSLFPLS